MAPTKKKTPTRRTRKTVDDSRQEEPQATTTTSSVASIAKPNNLLILLLILVSFFAGYLLNRVNNLEKSKTTTTQTADAQQTDTALSVDAMKKDAKDLGLDTNKFNKCLDSGESKDYITADSNQANSLGVQGTPGFFINGQFLGGAFPFENFTEIIDKQLAGTASGSCKDYSTGLQTYCKENSNSGFDPVAKTVDLGDAPMIGPADAKVTIVEFSDFQCPFCQRAYPTVKQVLKKYPNDVKLYYKELPLTSIHPYAQKAAEAAVCAQKQGKFWQMHDKLFESQGAAQTQ